MPPFTLAADLVRGDTFAEEATCRLQTSLLSFFRQPEVQDANGAFTRGTPEERVEAVVQFLRGEFLAHGGAGVPSPSAGAVPSTKPSKPRRVFLTGCFDLMHAGHFNALRQAKAVFPGEEVTLVAGVISDESIESAKGAPVVMRHEERVELLKACRWVDEIAENLTYDVPVSLLDKWNCEFIVHGDDLPRAPGGSGGLFDEVIAAGRLKIVKRTEGVSTTVLIGRLMSMSKDHLIRSEEPTSPLHGSPGQIAADPLWMMIPTMSRMVQFFGCREKTIGTAKRVVYAPGDWDLFHVGHVRFLEKASKLGDFLLLGCYSDDTVHKRKGRNFPIQTLQERSLNCLACKYVDDIVLAPPWAITKDLLTTMNVSVVAVGSNHPFATSSTGKSPSDEKLGDPYALAREKGILEVVASDSTLTMDDIADRIVANFATYVARQEEKNRIEEDYRGNKTFVAER